MSGVWQWADEPADDQVLALLTDSAAADLAGLGLDAETTATMAPMQARARLLGHRAQHPEAVAYVALAPDGSVLGRVLLDRSRTPWSVVDLVVHPAVRRTGIATALLARVSAAADAVRADLLLHVRPDNAAARSLYAAAGFADVASDGLDLVLRRQAAGDGDGPFGQ